MTSDRSSGEVDSPTVVPSKSSGIEDSEMTDTAPGAADRDTAAALAGVAVEDLPLLRYVAPDARRVVAASFTRDSYDFGDVIVERGEPSDALYLIVSGRARVVAPAEDGTEVTLNRLGPGDTFGEDGLLQDRVRSATVRASSATEVARLDGGVFRGLVATHAQIGEAVTLALRRHALSDFLSLRTEFGDLPPEALADLLGALEPVEVAADTAVIHQGDPSGPLYVVEEGRLQVSRGGREIGWLGPGDHFGERALFTDEPRSATVVATADTRLLQLPPDVFHTLLDRHEALRRQIARRVEQYDERDRARAAADEADAELLPADAAAPVEPVGEDQIDAEGAAQQRPDRAGPFATADGRFVKDPGRIRRFPKLLQVDMADCGAACLAMICRHHGRRIGLARVRELARTGFDGTSLSGLAEGGEQLGLATRRVKASRRNLDEMPLPAVLHWDRNHWVVVYDVTDDHVRLADPAVGHRRVDRDEFDEHWTGYAALFEPTEAFHEAEDDQVSFPWLWSLLRPFRGRLLAALFLALVVAGLQMTVPLITQLAVDRVVPSADLDLLTLLVLALGGITLALVAAGIGQRVLLSWVAVRADRDAMDRVSARMLALPMRYFYARRTGDIIRRFTGMREIMRIGVNNGVLALTMATQFIAAVVFMTTYNLRLSLLYLASVPLYVALTRYANRRLKPLRNMLEEARGKYLSHQVDAIKGIETVKAGGVEDALRNRLTDEFHRLTDHSYRARLGAMFYEGGVHVITMLSLILFVWFGVLEVLAGRLTIGGLVAFNALVVMANGPVRTLLGLYDEWEMVEVLLGRLSDVFEAVPEQDDDRDLEQVDALAGHVRLAGVSFSYGGANSPRVLDSITLDAPPGTTVAVVGRSGSGKTTLIKLLAGLMEPTAGTITFDGLDLDDLERHSLRRQIGMVLQETYLFGDTITNNIAFGDDDPDPARVEWAARAANAHEFVTRLPLRYETMVGETGLLLSGGQQQRIAIARAVYHRPPILLFDEATSALDTESERAVQDNMDRLLAGRTSFVIAHRLSTVRHADLIVVLERGRIVERGTHDELMDRKGLYFHLSSQQLDL